MNSPFTMVAVIIAVVGVVQIARMYFTNRRVQIEAGRPDELTQRKLAQLEERVRVLETIVTDQRHDLKREIDGL